jgi:hypothetical protein
MLDHADRNLVPPRHLLFELLGTFEGFFLALHALACSS